MEHLRTWTADGFRLDIWDTGRSNHQGKTYLHYVLYDDEWNPQRDRSIPGKVIFESADFACSPCHAIDSDRCLSALLAFLSLQTGDVDSEYFERHNYTRLQLAWRDARAEDLALARMATLPED